MEFVEKFQLAGRNEDEMDEFNQIKSDIIHKLTVYSIDWLFKFNYVA